MIPKKKQFLQEIVEPEVNTPVEPEVLQEIVEEEPVDLTEESKPKKKSKTKKFLGLA